MAHIPSDEGDQHTHAEPDQGPAQCRDGVARGEPGRGGRGPARQYVLNSDWGGRQASAETGTKYLERHGWEEYGAWHLGLTVGANDETKARRAFVYGDFRRIHRTGLIGCVCRASEWRHKDVELAARDLLQLLDAKAR